MCGDLKTSKTSLRYSDERESRQSVRYDPDKFPFVWSDICPDCDAEVVAVVEQTIGTPRPIGGLMRVPFEARVVWMQACSHTDELYTHLN